MENYSSLVDAINDLKAKGYVEDLNLKQDCLVCQNGAFQLYPDDFHIDQALRFDVDTDAGDQSILYAISSDKYQLKGLLVNGYGIYTDAVSNEMMEKLKY